MVFVAAATAHFTVKLNWLSTVVSISAVSVFVLMIDCDPSLPAVKTAEVMIKPFTPTVLTTVVASIVHPLFAVMLVPVVIGKSIIRLAPLNSRSSKSSLFPLVSITPEQNMREVLPDLIAFAGTTILPLALAKSINVVSAVVFVTVLTAI